MRLNSYSFGSLERPSQEELMGPTLAKEGDTVVRIHNIVAIYWHMRLFVSWYHGDVEMNMCIEGEMQAIYQK